MNNYVVATVKPWNIDAFHRLNAGLPGQWHLVSDPEDLPVGYLEELSPHYVFPPIGPGKFLRLYTPGMLRVYCRKAET